MLRTWIGASLAACSLNLSPVWAAPYVLLPSSPTVEENGIPTNWEPLTFRKIHRHTQYAWDTEEQAIHASSDASASGLIYRLDRKAAETPILRWRWKIKRVLPTGNARTKDGDDYPARLYVMFRYDKARASRSMRFKYGLAKKLYGEYPPHAGINYIWANQLHRGLEIENAYTDRVRMVAVRSGNGEAEKWRTEERDILEDYRRLFKEEPPHIDGIALMTDTDNTEGRADAWYADIGLHPRTPKDDSKK